MKENKLEREENTPQRALYVHIKSSQGKESKIYKRERVQSGCKEKILTKKGEDIKKKCQVEKEKKRKNCQK